MNDICDIICHLIFHADTHTLIDLTDLSGYYIRILLFNEELPNHWGGVSMSRDTEMSWTGKWSKHEVQIRCKDTFNTKALIFLGRINVND